MMKLDWEGLSNARDLGGIALKNGGWSRARAYARSDHPLMLSPCGWEQLAGYGIRTIVSLETAGLEGGNALRANRPVVVPEKLDITLLRMPIEDGADEQFMDRWARTGLWGTPLYFADALQRWPSLYGDALNGIAEAKGPILLHCGRGHDRTGMVSLLLLTIAGATAHGITEDYLLSSRNLLAREPRSVEMLEEALSQEGTTAFAAIQSAMDIVDGRWLHQAGVTSSSLATIRASLRSK